MRMKTCSRSVRQWSDKWSYTDSWGCARTECLNSETRFLVLTTDAALKSCMKNTINSSGNKKAVLTGFFVPGLFYWVFLATLQRCVRRQNQKAGFWIQAIRSSEPSRILRSSFAKSLLSPPRSGFHPQWSYPVHFQSKKCLDYLCCRNRRSAKHLPRRS